MSPRKHLSLESGSELFLCEGEWIIGSVVVFATFSGLSSKMRWWVFTGELMRHWLGFLRLPCLFL